MTPNFKLIGLAGPAGAGKDTVADYMVDAGALRKRKLAFADPIKEAVKAIFGWTDEDLSSRAMKEAVDDLFGISPRYAMQTLGTEWGRELINQDLWLLAMRRRLGQLEGHIRLVVIPDVRFQNEVDLIRSFQGTVIWVDRPTSSVSVSWHVSEMLDASKTDGVIYNHGTLDELPRAIEAAFEVPVAEGRK